MNPQKPSNIINLFALIILVVVAAGSIFYVKPLWDDVSSLQKGVAEKTDTRKSLNEQLTTLQKIQKDLGGSSEVKKETTLAAIPEKLDQDKLIEDLSGIAIKNDMALNGVSFSIPGASNEGEVAVATLNANLTGNETNLIGFLKDVEGNSRKLMVKNISIQVGENEFGLERVNFSVSMEAYYQGLI